MNLLLLLAAPFAADLDSLSAPSYRERELATARLRAAGVQAVPALWYGVRHGEPETAARCRGVLSRYAPLVEEIVAVQIVAGEGERWLTADGARRLLDVVGHHRLKEIALRHGWSNDNEAAGWESAEAVEGMTELDTIWGYANVIRGRALGLEAAP